jgi:DNA helicase IV
MGFFSWLNGLFKPQEEYGTPSVTLTGQPVRSKAERVIADYFTHHGIPYYYEAEATTNDWFLFKSKISRPDFYLPQYKLYVEYWGLVDSPDPRTRDNYIRTMRWKMAQYRKNNIRFISIEP